MRRKPSCRKCGRKNFRKSGLIPSNPAEATKGWKGPNAKGDGYHKEAVARLFHRRYCCINCGHQMKINR